MYQKYNPLEMQCVIVLSKHEGENMTSLRSVEILLLTSKIQSFTQF